MIRHIRRIPLTSWILISMVVGVILGTYTPDLAHKLAPLSTVFLRMIKSIIVPLIFGTLVVGIAGHGDDMKRVGRLALKSIIYFEIVWTLALAIGLIAVNVVKPGQGVALVASAEAGKELAHNTQSGTTFLEHLVPTSFFDAAAKNEVLQIVFFAVLFAVALSKVQGRSKEIVLAGCEGLADVMFKFTLIVMRFAPFGIGAAIAVTVAQGGLGVLLNLGKLVLTLYGALIAFFLLVLLPIAVIFRVPLKRFVRAVRAPALIAFSTTSSEAALPLAMQSMEAIGVPSDRSVCDADGILLQPRRLYALPGGRVDLRRPGSWCSDVDREPALHDADADDHEQRRGGGSACVARHFVGHACDVRFAARRCRDYSGRRCADGHGADEHEPGRELSRDSRDG